MTETVKLKRQKHKKNIILIYLEYIPVLILYHIFLLLPLSAAYRVGRFCFGVANYFDWKHRRRTISHLLHAGVVSTLQDARKTAHEVYCKMGMLFVEIIQMSKCYDPSRFRLTGDAEAVRWIEEEEPNRSFIFLTAHYGNWEFAGPAIADYCRTPLTSIMRPFSNPKIGELVLKHRRSPMHTLVGKEGGIRDLLRALKRNQMVAVLVDQHAATGEGVETLFFGQPARTHTSVAKLHLKTGVPMAMTVTRRYGKNFELEMVFGKLISYQQTADTEKDIRIVTQLFTWELEKLIRQDVTEWMWLHRRWLNLGRRDYEPVMMERAQQAWREMQEYLAAQEKNENSRPSDL